jgi:hypothetical protein
MFDGKNDYEKGYERGHENSVIEQNLDKIATGLLGTEEEMDGLRDGFNDSCKGEDIRNKDD